MARPSKLTEKQWAEIERRHLAGEGVRDLAKEYKIAPSNISKRVSKQTQQQKEVANQLAAAEMNFSRLPVSQQIATRKLADEIKFRDENMVSAAIHLSAVTKAWSKAADDSTIKAMFKSLDDDGVTVNPDRLKDCTEEMTTVMKSIQIAKEASHVPLKTMEIAARSKEPSNEERKIVLINAPED